MSRSPIILLHLQKIGAASLYEAICGSHGAGKHMRWQH